MTSEGHAKKDWVSDEKVPTLTSKRWILAYMGAMGFFCVYALRVNLSVAIVCMVKDIPDNTTSNITNSSSGSGGSDDSCGLNEATNSTQNHGEFDWDKTIQGIILSSFFYGYIATNVLGGWLSGVFGGRRVWGTGMFIAATSTVLIPVAARYSFKVVIFLRVVNGLAQGVSFPSMHAMLGKWAPLADRSKLASFTYAGQNIGIIVTDIVSGVLCAKGFDNGWGSIFYVTGGVVFLWVIGWFLLVADSPELHPTISKAERNYIVTGRGKTSHRDIVVPWLAIAKSRAMWACLSAHIGNNWLNYTLVTGLPSFMKEVLKFDIQQNGVFTAIPYMVMTVTMISAGQLADFVRKRWLSTTYTRRLFQSAAFLGAGACMVGVGFVDCSHRMIAVVILAVAVGFEGLCFAGYMVNQVDFAPRYAGVLMGITNMIATVPGILAPTIIGALTPNKTQDEWRTVFYICAALCLFGAIFFGGFASGDLEPWAVVTSETPDTADDTEKSRQEEEPGQTNAAFSNGDETTTAPHKDKYTTEPMWTKL